MSYIAVLAKGSGIVANREALTITLWQKNKSKGMPYQTHQWHEGYPIYPYFQPVPDEEKQQAK